MITFLTAIVLALLLHVSLETRFRVPRRIGRSMARVRVGRMRLDLIVYRPRRCYAHVVVG